MRLLVPVILGFVTLTASVNVPDFENATTTRVEVVSTTSFPVIEQSGVNNVNQKKSVLPGEGIGWDSTGKVLP